jgi:hypothetical protein
MVLFVELEWQDEKSFLKGHGGLFQSTIFTMVAWSDTREL